MVAQLASRNGVPALIPYRFRSELINANVFFRPSMKSPTIWTVRLRRYDCQHLKATFIGIDARGYETAGSGAFNHQTHIFLPILESQAKDELVNDALIRACDACSPNTPEANR